MAPGQARSDSTPTESRSARSRGELCVDGTARKNSAADFQKVAAQIRRVESSRGADHLEIGTIFKQKLLRFAPPAQCSRAPFLDRECDHRQPKQPFGDGILSDFRVVRLAKWHRCDVHMSCSPFDLNCGERPQRRPLTAGVMARDAPEVVSGRLERSRRLTC